MKLFSVLLGICYIEICFADITCYLNLVKNSCWNDFNVNIDVVSMVDRKELAKGTIEKGSKWKRIEFQCQPGEAILYSADFSPVFWQTDKGQKYFATQFWSLPKSLKKGDIAWELTICFPRDFSGVPVPPTAGSNCACQLDQVKPLPFKASDSSQN